jgi:hypothetical protein
MEWRYNHRIHRKDTPVAQDTPPPEIAGAHRYGCRGKTSLPVTVDHVFSNSEKWSNSARFHGVGFTARLMACGAFIDSGLGEKLNSFCLLRPKSRPGLGVSGPLAHTSSEGEHVVHFQGIRSDFCTESEKS